MKNLVTKKSTRTKKQKNTVTKNDKKIEKRRKYQ